jgi:hypothetical protein
MPSSAGAKPAEPQQRTTLLLQNLHHLFLDAWLFNINNASTNGKTT